MPSDNPFSEPHDSDRTVFIPSPGGRRPAPPAPGTPAAPPAAAAEAAPVAGPERIAGEGEPLLAAAAPLTALLARLPRTARPPDGGDLRERTVAELRRFEAQAREAGVPMAQLRPAHYALCAALDDVVLATPWGAESAWMQRSLVSTFHQQVRSGEEFFAVLRQVSAAPAANLPVLELMYLCLSLGFQGQYRLSARGPAELERVRENLYALILRQRPAADPELSPHWRGLDAPWRPRGAELPLWVGAAIALAAVAGVFAWVLFGVNAGADPVLARLYAAPPPAMPTLARAAPVAPPPPIEGGVLDRLRGFLAPEIAAHLVTVVGTEAVPVVRITGSGMFPSGSAAVDPRFDALLARIGQALRTEPGAVTVAGYTDNQPLRRTIRFPSNFALSAARAQAAADLLARGIDDPRRLTAEGRGEADPIAPNDTAAGRERNRRIEIALHRTA